MVTRKDSPETIEVNGVWYDRRDTVDALSGLLAKERDKTLTESKKLSVDFYPENVELEIDANRTVGIYAVGRTEVMGWVTGPRAEIDLSASYTFEAEVEGVWYRWTGQTATLESPDRFLFRLRNGQPFTATKPA